jgi:hypothetical protein
MEPVPVLAAERTGYVSVLDLAAADAISGTRPFRKNYKAYQNKGTHMDEMVEQHSEAMLQRFVRKAELIPHIPA